MSEIPSTVGDIIRMRDLRNEFQTKIEQLQAQKDSIIRAIKEIDPNFTHDTASILAELNQKQNQILNLKKTIEYYNIILTKMELEEEITQEIEEEARLNANSKVEQEFTNDNKELFGMESDGDLEQAQTNYRKIFTKLRIVIGLEASEQQDKPKLEQASKSLGLIESSNTLGGINQIFNKIIPLAFSIYKQKTVEDGVDEEFPIESILKNFNEDPYYQPLEEEIKFIEKYLSYFRFKSYQEDESISIFREALVRALINYDNPTIENESTEDLQIKLLNLQKEIEELQAKLEKFQQVGESNLEKKEDEQHRELLDYAGILDYQIQLLKDAQDQLQEKYRQKLEEKENQKKDQITSLERVFSQSSSGTKPTESSIEQKETHNKWNPQTVEEIFDLKGNIISILENKKYNLEKSSTFLGNLKSNRYENDDIEVEVSDTRFFISNKEYPEGGTISFDNESDRIVCKYAGGHVDLKNSTTQNKLKAFKYFKWTLEDLLDVDFEDLDTLDNTKSFDASSSSSIQASIENQESDEQVFQKMKTALEGLRNYLEQNWESSPGVLKNQKLYKKNSQTKENQKIKVSESNIEISFHFYEERLSVPELSILIEKNPSDLRIRDTRNKIEFGFVDDLSDPNNPRRTDTHTLSQAYELIKKDVLRIYGINLEELENPDTKTIAPTTLSKELFQNTLSKTESGKESIDQLVNTIDQTLKKFALDIRSNYIGMSDHVFSENGLTYDLPKNRITITEKEGVFGVHFHDNTSLRTITVTVLEDSHISIVDTQGEHKFNSRSSFEPQPLDEIWPKIKEDVQEMCNIDLNNYEPQSRSFRFEDYIKNDSITLTNTKNNASESQNNELKKPRGKWEPQNFDEVFALTEDLMEALDQLFENIENSTITQSNNRKIYSVNKENNIDIPIISIVFEEDTISLRTENSNTVIVISKPDNIDNSVHINYKGDLIRSIQDFNNSDSDVTLTFDYFKKSLKEELGLDLDNLDTSTTTFNQQNENKAVQELVENINWHPETLEEVQALIPDFKEYLSKLNTPLLKNVGNTFYMNQDDSLIEVKFYHNNRSIELMVHYNDSNIPYTVEIINNLDKNSVYIQSGFGFVGSNYEEFDDKKDEEALTAIGEIFRYLEDAGIPIPE